MIAGVVVKGGGANRWGYLATEVGFVIDMGVATVEGEAYVLSTDAGLIMAHSQLASGNRVSFVGVGGSVAQTIVLNPWHTGTTK